MTKSEYLNRLKTALLPLPSEEREAAIAYYEEFFSDAGEENEQSVISELGMPEELAKSIIDENNRDNPFCNNDNQAHNNDAFSNPSSQENTNQGYAENNYQFNQANNPNTAYNANQNSYNAGYNNQPAQSAKWSNGQIALFIVLLVLASPLWLGLLGVAIGLIATVFGVLISLIVACGAVSIGFLVGGIAALFQNAATGIMMLGIALIFAGLFPLAIYPLCKVTVKGIAALIKAISNKFGKKKEASR